MMSSCTRCHGLLVPEDVRGMDFRYEGWRCMNCGAIVDPVILKNRIDPPVVNNRAEPRYGDRSTAC